MAAELHGKVALVTGAGTGIGRATTLALASAGADVLVHYSTSKDAAEEVVGLARGVGRRAHALQADFTDRAGVARLAEAAQSRWGRVDVLVNNAAMLERPIDVTEGGDFGEHLDAWDAVFDVNLRAPYELTWRLAQGMMTRGSGAVVNVASVAGHYALTDVPLYSLSKSALMHFTRQAAARYGPKVRVNAIAPGWIETAFGQGHVLDPAFRESVSQDIPLRRVGKPEEVAEAVLFLATNSYVHGATVTIDGGLVSQLR